MKKLTKLNAFTLVELSIVLVIIGLLTAGVVGGQSLIESAKQRNLISKINGLETAIKAFELEYDALPGDFNNAFAYWGSSCTTIHNSGTPTAGTCNGGGDKIINSVQESTGFWKHLQLAGILPGNYTMNTAVTAVASGVNAGPSPFDGTAMVVRFYGPANCLTKNGATSTLEVGTPNPASSNADITFMTSKNAKSIDTKFDDGKGCSGKFTGQNGACPGWNASTGTDYSNLSSSSLCTIQYNLYTP